MYILGQVIVSWFNSLDHGSLIRSHSITIFAKHQLSFSTACKQSYWRGKIKKYNLFPKQTAAYSFSHNSKSGSRLEILALVTTRFLS